MGHKIGHNHDEDDFYEAVRRAEQLMNRIIHRHFKEQDVLSGSGYFDACEV
jgi:hypothetical protein